jgi:cation transport ATPase
MQVTPVDGKVTIGDVEYDVSMFTGMAAIDATGKALKLQDVRVQFKATPNSATLPVTYTVALVATREPIDEVESAKVQAKAAEQKARKDEKQAKEDATRERDLKRAEQSGRDGVLSVMGQVGQIAQAAHVLASLTNNR